MFHQTSLMLHCLPRCLKRPGQKISLRLVLVVPFVLQIVGAVSLVGYLSFQSGQQGVEKLANQLTKEVGERIGDRLNTYLHTPHHIVAVNHLAVAQGTLNPNNFEQVRQLLWLQTNLNPSIPTIYFWSDRGEMIGYGRILTEEFRQQAEKLTGKNLPMGTIYLMEIRKTHLNQRNIYLVNDRGQPKKLVYKFADDFHKLPWYKQAKTAKKQTWSPIFVFRKVFLWGIQADAPIYEADGQLQGIFTSSFSLANISTFLNQLHFSPTGQTFIIERSGDLVATSTSEIPYIKQAHRQIKRLAAVNSKDPRTREIAQQLLHKFGNFDKILTAQQLNLIYKQQRQFVRVVPYQDKYGLDWLVVIMVPESDFMAEIQANTRNTILLCGGALGFAIALGLFTANQITRRISQINQASRELANGKLDRHLETESQVQELGELAQSFNQMADQLRQSFERIQIAFYESEAKFTTVFRTSPDPIAILTLAEGRIQEANNRCIEFFGYSRGEFIGRTTVELELWRNLKDRQQFRQLLQQDRSVENLEVDLCRKSGAIATVLLSAEIRNLEGQDYIIVAIKDISGRKQAEAALRESEERFRSLFENSPVAYLSLDEQGRYIDVNTKQCNLLGYPREELLGKSFGEFWSKETKDRFPKRLAYLKKEGSIRSELQLVGKDGVPITALLEGRVQYDPNGQFLKTHCILYNITERKRMEETLRQTRAKLQQANQELEKLVNIDALTQVANRRRFNSYLQQEWRRLLRERKPLSLIMFDVDYFKRYNDRYGHQEGDECLLTIAQATQQVVHRPGDLVARYGGEEFAIILPNTNQEGAIAVAERIRAAIHALSIPHTGSKVRDIVTVSLGIASLIPSTEACPEKLIEQADQALYIAKNQGRDRFAVA